MDKLEEIDLLRVQNLSLREDALRRERDDLTRALIAKYGQPGDTGISWGPDGTIKRAPKLEAVP
jgi:hypothetical protein